MIITNIVILNNPVGRLIDPQTLQKFLFNWEISLTHLLYLTCAQWKNGKYNGPALMFHLEHKKSRASFLFIHDLSYYY